MTRSIGVQRLLAAAALRNGLSVDAYVERVLSAHALEIAREEMVYEQFAMLDDDAAGQWITGERWHAVFGGRRVEA